MAYETQVSSGGPNPILFVLEEYGLRQIEDQRALTGAIFELSESRATSLLDALTSSLEYADPYEPPGDLDVFNFLASSVLRGDSLCTAPDCQAKQLAILGRFAALYADTVVFPIEFKTFDPNTFDGRVDLLHNTLALVKLAPLIEAGIVRITPSLGCVCNDCLCKRGGGDTRRLMTKAKRFWRDRSDRFDIVYRPDRNGLQATGPTDFLPHSLNVEAPEFAGLKGRRAKLIDGEPGISLSRTMVRSKNILNDHIFSSYLRDLLVQQTYGLASQTTYITDSPGQAAFFETVAGVDESEYSHASMANAARFAASLAHTLPLVADLPLETVLKVRAQESDAFVRYRATINKLVRERAKTDKRLTDAELRDLFQDELRPRIAELTESARVASTSSKKRAMFKAGSVGLAVSLGVLSGLLPSEYKAALLAAGGTKLFGDLIEALLATGGTSTELRNNNLYFLLRLLQKST